MTAVSPVRHVVLDRDGVLAVEGAASPASAEEWRWEPSARDALALLAGAGIVVSVATNQSAVGRGLVAAVAVDELHRWLAERLAEMGVSVVGIFACYHDPDAGCECRKPLPGLVAAAVAASGVPASESLLIGDDLRDLEAAAAAGVAATLVRTGKGASVEARVPHGTPVHDDLLAAVEQLLAS